LCRFFIGQPHERPPECVDLIGHQKHLILNDHHGIDAHDEARFAAILGQLKTLSPKRSHKVNRRENLSRHLRKPSLFASAQDEAPAEFNADALRSSANEHIFTERNFGIPHRITGGLPGLEQMREHINQLADSCGFQFG
jgi:hypothetical protein